MDLSRGIIILFVLFTIPFLIIPSVSFAFLMAAEPRAVFNDLSTVTSRALSWVVTAHVEPII